MTPPATLATDYQQTTTADALMMLMLLYKTTKCSSSLFSVHAMFSILLLPTLFWKQE